MTIDQLKKALTAQPFKPFAIRTADGRGFFVPHPEFVWSPPGASREVWVADRDGTTAALLDVMLVTSLDFTAQDTNGQNGTNGTTHDS